MLNADEQKLHQKALRLSRGHRQLESRLIQVLREIERGRLFRKLGLRSLFQYCMQALEMTESVSYHFISVARKCSEVGALDRAIADGSLSVSKASRIVPSLNRDNAEHLIAFARTHSSREIDFETARIRGDRVVVQERIKVISENLLKLELGICKDFHRDLLRAQDLVSSQTARPAGYLDVLKKAVGEFLDRHDPVRKAERAAKRKSTATVAVKLRPNRVRQPLDAATNHALARRDGGRCTHRDASGKRCDQERWLHVHHVIPVHAGGTNELENLTTLCSFHHDLAHQPISASLARASGRGRW